MFESLSFPELLILVLVGLLFFKENMLSWLSKKLGVSGESVPEWANSIITQQHTLAEYFNHDTTAQHDLTHAKLDRIETKVDKHNEVELGNSNKLDELIRIANR